MKIIDNDTSFYFKIKIANLNILCFLFIPHRLENILNLYFVFEFSFIWVLKSFIFRIKQHISEKHDFTNKLT